MKRVTVTGLGVVAPNGVGTDAFWANCRAGKSGISAIDTFDTTNYPVKVAGLVRDFDAADFVPSKVCDKTDRFVHLGAAAAAMALRDSGLNGNGDWRDDTAVILGSGLGGQMFHEAAIARAYRDGIASISPISVPAVMPNSVTAHIAILNQLRGPNLCISTACSSAANAIGEAFRRVRSGDSTIVVTGGVEAPVSPFNFFAHCSMKVLSTAGGPPEEVSRPFDSERAGFVMAEGAAILVLEDYESARARGAHVYAEIVGFASNSGAHHMAMPDPTARDLVRVMSGAIRDAGIEPAAIDYVNAHGTGTKPNDEVEIRGLEGVFGDHISKVAIGGSKSMLGHSLGAAGALEAAICALSLRDQVLTPTINLRHPAFPYDFVAEGARASELECVLSNSFGFGSNNSCLVFRRHHAE